jgi:hypothetical protein
MRQKTKPLTLIMTIVSLATLWATTLMAQETIDQPLKAVVSLDKGTFLINEAIWLTIVIQNVSQDKILGASADPMSGRVRIDVVSANGDTLYGGCIIGTAVGTPPTLEPGEKDLYFVDLVGSICNYGVENEDALHYGRLLPEGEYHVQVVVRFSDRETAADALSNKVDFEVAKPEGKEKEAYDLLVKGNKKCYPEKKWDEGRQIIRKMIAEYPNSVYQDAALLLVPSRFNDEETALRFIEDRPNSGLAPSVILWTIPGSGKATERKRFLEEIAQNHPNTKAGMYAQNRLDKWRRGKIWHNEPMPED